MEQHQVLLNQPQWAKLTYAQLYKDAALSGVEWAEYPIPQGWENWLIWVEARLDEMDKQNPELLSRFLYRVDLPESHFRENPFPGPELAEAVLRREFMKVWLKEKYKG